MTYKHYLLYRLVSVKQRRIKYSKACEVSHPCNSTICHSWPHLDGTGKFLSYYTWPNPLTWPPVYLESWPVSHLMLCFPYASRPKELYSSCIMLYMGLNPQPLAQLPAIHSTSILSPLVFTKHWNFLTATDPLVYFPYSLAGLGTLCPNRLPVSAVRTVRCYKS